MGGPNWRRKGGWSSLDDDGGISEYMYTANPCGPRPWLGITCNSTSTPPAASHVTRLELPQNNLEAPSLQPAAVLLKDLPHLTIFDVSNLGNDKSPEFVTRNANRIGGAMPEAICGVGSGSLEELNLAYINISGTLPRCLDGTEMPRLRVVNLNFNAIEGATPSAVCSLGALEELLLRGNRMTGRIPECLGSGCARLRKLDYTSLNADGGFPGPQSLEGTIPRSICELEHLEELQLQFTRGINGSIPNCLGSNQDSLRAVVLSGNKLTGEIPESLCAIGDSFELFYAYDNYVRLPHSIQFNSIRLCHNSRNLLPPSKYAHTCFFFCFIVSRFAIANSSRVRFPHALG